MSRINKWILDDENEVDFEDAEAVNQTDGELNDTIVTYEGNTSDVQSWTDFIGSFVNGMKIGKFFKNLYAGIQYVLHVGSLVNNCVTDNSDLPLSAAQGKVLMDEITQLNSALTGLGDFNVITTDLAANGSVTLDYSSYRDLIIFTARGYSTGVTPTETARNTIILCDSWNGISYLVGTDNRDNVSVSVASKVATVVNNSSLGAFGLFAIMAI